jgi:glycosyltransferase involved in cell wall biosynthesis
MTLPSIEKRLRLSVIIPTYNRGGMLRQTIESFLNQSIAPECYEIIISNNNSTDNTIEVINHYLGENKIIYHEEKSQGVHYARNNAFKKTSGEILYFTDDDMIADFNLLEEVLKVFDKHHDVAVVTGKIIPRFLTPPPRWVKNHLHNSLLSLTRKNKPNSILISEKDSEIEVFSCHQAIRREVFVQSGGFNPENTKGVWIGDGETGLNIKIEKLGGVKFAYTPFSKIEHLIPESRMTLSYIIRRLSNEGYCSACTDYRQHKLVKKLKNDITKSMLGLIRFLIKEPVRLFLKKSHVYLSISKTSFWLHKIVYAIKLGRDPSLRQLIEKDNWLE